MTPAEALKILENIKSAAPADRQAACNTIAMEAATWAQQAINRDLQLRESIIKLDKGLKQLVGFLTKSAGASVPEGAEADATTDAAPAATNGTNGTHATAEGEVDPSKLKGPELEAYMDAVLAGMPPNASAPQPSRGFGASAAQNTSNDEPLVSVDDAPPVPPQGVVVVPAAAAKAQARAQQNSGPKA